MEQYITLIGLRHAIQDKDYQKWTNIIKTIDIQHFILNDECGFQDLLAYVIKKAYSKKHDEKLSDAHLQITLNLIENGIQFDNSILEEVLLHISRGSVNLHDDNFIVLIETLILKSDLHASCKHRNRTLFTGFYKRSHFEWFLNFCKKLSVLDDNIYISLFHCFVLHENIDDYQDKDLNLNLFLKYLDDNLYSKCISSLSQDIFLSRFKYRFQPTNYKFCYYFQFILSLAPEMFMPIFFTPNSNGKTMMTQMDEWHPSGYMCNEVREQINIHAKKILLTNDLWILESYYYSFYWQWLPSEMVENIFSFEKGPTLQFWSKLSFSSEKFLNQIKHCTR